ncbi:MAG TPA: hypothetical protein PKD91_15620 [Bacteroidia bacterium]|nr:hypothetical protein [Bacteroidia bacterium]
MSVINNAPHGFLVCLTRPFITDHGSFLITLSALENVAVLLLGIFAFSTMKTKSLQQKTLPWFGIFYTITLFVLIGLVTPVMGAIVRYKAQALPFLVTFFILLSGVSFKEMLTKLISKAKA